MHSTSTFSFQSAFYCFWYWGCSWHLEGMGWACWEQHTSQRVEWISSSRGYSQHFQLINITIWQWFLHQQIRLLHSVFKYVNNFFSNITISYLIFTLFLYLLTLSQLFFQLSQSLEEKRLYYFNYLMCLCKWLQLGRIFGFTFNVSGFLFLVFHSNHIPSVN